LEKWKSYNDKVGQGICGYPDSEFCLSCKLIGIKKDGYARCQSKKYGKCVFYCCQERSSYMEWLEHHRQFHPKDDLLYVACNECNNIRNKEVDFMNDAISDLENKLNRVKNKSDIRRGLADIVTKCNVK